MKRHREMQLPTEENEAMPDPGGESPEAIVRIEGLTRRFGPKVALNNVSLTVPRGVVFGLVGANGAGKTTLIRHVVGLLKASAGTVRVNGRDPVADPVGVLSRIGFLSEENDLPGWMRVGELIRYTGVSSRAGTRRMPRNCDRRSPWTSARR